ncbi:MAG TPA: GNAT family N-acetyltransferase [Gemmatimonadales bacterium]|nr:GNAT family N-acetyltransferase [Gemmatimonadales bacterium]
MTEKTVLSRFTLPVDVTIRQVQTEDLSALEWDGRFTEHRSIIENTFRGQTAGRQLMLVAEARGASVGQVWIDLDRYRSERIGIIWALRVRSPLKGLGLGTRLIEQAEHALISREYLQAQIGVEPHNAGAIRLYQRLGYLPAGEEIDRIRYHTPEGELREYDMPLLLFRKRLSRTVAPARAERRSRVI